MTQSLTLRDPDDWHLHLRDGAMMEGVLPAPARDFRRAIIMPNLVPPVVTGDDAAAYRERILAALPEGADFEPLMTLYLTETTDAGDVRAAAEAGIVKAVKLYPAGATTNSASGVRDFDKVRGVLETMAEIGLPQHEVPLALLMFNVGVETGQLLFIAVVLSLIAILKRLPFSAPQGAWRVVPYGIGGLAAYWTIDRVMSFVQLA